MDDELTSASAVRLREMIGAAEVSPVEVVQACLDRIEAEEPSLHSFLHVAAERALEQATEAERAVARGDRLGPLHGVPVALKDEAWTAGMPSTAGSLLFAGFIPRRDGTVAERLRAAGAILIGKTQLPEFATWPRSKTRLAPESVNPWDRTRISGASSGGSAAAVAAGLVPLAIGSDGGGSIRIPSALCGVVGLHPTPGRVPSYGSFSYSTAASLGPIARTVGDAALLQTVIAGPDHRDAWALTEAPPDVLGSLDAGVGGLRIAWSADYGHIPVRSEVRDVVEAAVGVLARLGAAVEPVTDVLGHPWGDASLMAGLQAAVAAMGGEDFGRDVDEVPNLDAEEDWMWSVFARTVPFTATDEFAALCRRYRHLLAPHSTLLVDSAGGPDLTAAFEPYERKLRTAVGDLLDRYDVLCSPTMAQVAPLAPEGWATPYPDPYMGTNFTFLANTTGCVAASVPCGFVDGLPVGLHVVGRPGAEATVLQVCRAYEHAMTS
jgi:Asp-tRNA(Asn)/Glu-tRNA(Gln) amidotransferase A subunit family amidase